MLKIKWINSSKIISLILLYFSYYVLFMDFWGANMLMINIFFTIYFILVCINLIKPLMIIVLVSLVIDLSILLLSLILFVGIAISIFQSSPEGVFGFYMVPSTITGLFYGYLSVLTYFYMKQLI